MDSSTRTRQLAVNAAFLKEIKDDNLLLKSLWDQLATMLVHTELAINHWPELVSLLARLRDQMAVHFALEEAYGYFDDAIDVAPHLSLNAENLRSQHRSLFEEICDLAESIIEVHLESESVASFIARIQTFRKKFEAHEEAELKLILTSLDDDIGVCD